MGIGLGMLLRLPGWVDGADGRDIKAIIDANWGLGFKAIQLVQLVLSADPARRAGIPHRHLVLSRC